MTGFDRVFQAITAHETRTVEKLRRHWLVPSNGATSKFFSAAIFRRSNMFDGF
jgi:hypothetical protein